MKGKLFVILPPLTEAHRKAILETAGKCGYEVRFFANGGEALPFIADAEIIFSSASDLAGKAPNLKWFCAPSAGVNQFTAPGAFLSPDAVLTNSSGAYGVTIAEHVVMLILEMLRRQQDYTDIVSRREWIRNLPIRSIRGSRITFAGTGDIGQECALRLRAFSPAVMTGLNRSGHNPRDLFDRAQPMDRLDEVLPETDILILSLPGTPQTYHLISREKLALLPDHALIVNVGRGSLIDQKALMAELRSGRLKAALDVFEQEPIPADDPIWDCPNLHIMPHVAGNMTLPYTVDKIVSMFLEDLENYASGHPLKHQVDLKKGY